MDHHIADALRPARLMVLAHFANAWNAHDLDGLMDCMAEECSFHAAAGPEAEGAIHTGRAAVRAAYAAIFQAFPDAKWEPTRLVLSGDTAFTGWRFTATRAADGAKVEVDGGDILIFHGNEIALKDSYRKARG